MAVNFPSSPSNGDTVTVGGIAYVYDSTQGVWSDSPQGLTQSIDNLTDVDTSTTAPANRQVLQWSSTSEEWGPADSGVQVYATIDDLPLSGVTEGSMALVDSTDKLYIFSDSGWYSIAIVNQTPSISGVSATYSLASDGTATTVTITATDPEGVPLTYSIVSDTSGNIATVAQGTGANTNQWTITPSTNTTNAGNFTLVFRASDGVNIASASSTFQLQFAVENSNYTTALITSVGANNAVNNSFVDSSTNSHTITATGNTTQTTFSPYRHGGYSTYFDGNGDYLASDNNNIGNFGTGDFTIEGWLWVPDRSALYTVVDGRPTTLTSASGWSVAINTSGGMYVYSGGFHISGTNGDVTTETWHHWALTRSSGDMKLFLNGTQQGSTNSTARDYTANLFRVGASGTGGEVFKGYQRDVRVVKGTALYTSNFTKPDESLTAVTNTTFLGCHLPYIADGSTNGHSITVNGNTKTEPFSPYDYETYSATDNGGSMYFDGTGDRLTFSHASDFTFGTGDLTIEFWIKAPTNAITGGYSRTICEIGQFRIYLRITQYHGGTDGALLIYDGSTGVDIGGTVTLSDDVWHHVAVVRESGTAKCWVDGNYMTGVSHTTSLSETSTNAIGSQADGNGSFQGHIADVRVVKGDAVYTGTSAFTPPTERLTAITNTSLLLNGTNAGIIDKAQTAESVQLFGDTKSATDQTKYLSSSIYFDGTGDYLKIPSSGNFLAEGAWTQEMWVRLAGTGTGQQIGPAFGGGAGAWNSSNGHQWLLFTHSSGFLVQYYGTNNSHNTITIASSVPFTANTWHHWAISWDGTTLRFFVDGTLEHSTTSFTPNTMTSTYTELGRMPDNSYYSQAHYSDVRITKGLARYTANFTAPTAALQG